MTLQNEIRRLLLNKIKEGQETEHFNDADNLFAKGIVSSLEILDLVVALEDAFKIRIPHYEVVESNFHSLDAIAKYLQSKGVVS